MIWLNPGLGQAIVELLVLDLVMLAVVVYMRRDRGGGDNG